MASTKKKYFDAHCAVEACDKPRRRGHPYCGMHARRLRRNGHLGPNRRPNGAGGFTKAGYVLISKSGVVKYEHIIVAERMYGGPLPKGAQVHHKNKNPSDNRPENLEIFLTDAEHKERHRRERALAACGNEDWRSCCFCSQYDSLDNLVVRRAGREIFHRECQRAYDRSRLDRRRKPGVVPRKKKTQVDESASSHS